MTICLCGPVQSCQQKFGLPPTIHAFIAPGEKGPRPCAEADAAGVRCSRPNGHISLADSADCPLHDGTFWHGFECGGHQPSAPEAERGGA